MGHVQHENRRHRVRVRSGSYAILLALALVTLLGFAALAVDLSFLHTIAYEAQNAATVGSHAALVEIRAGGNAVAVETAMNAALAANTIAGQPVDPSIVEMTLTHWDFSGTADDLSPFNNAVRVRVGLTAANGNPVGLFLGPLLGVTSSDVHATTTAALRTWEVMLVQDVSRTMMPFMVDAKLGARHFLGEVWNSPLDSVGMVTYDGLADAYSASTPWTALTPILTSAVYGSIDGQWSGLVWSGRTNGSNPGPAIEMAIDEMLDYGDPESFRAIVVISNRAPFHPASGTAAFRTAASAAANRADGQGIAVFVVYYDETGSAADAGFMEALVRGVGEYYEVTDPTDLELALGEIAQRIPIALVQ